MNNRDEIVKWMNEFLRLYEYKDYGPQGLQFIGNEDIKNIACSVSATVETIARAAFFGADMLIAHHGIFWAKDQRIIDASLALRLDSLEDYHLNLCGYHLCLDAHPEIGNNILVAKSLNLADPQRFGEIGWGGRIKDSREFYNDVLATFPSSNDIGFKMFCDNLDRAAIVTGAGGGYIRQAKLQGYDVLITGEVTDDQQETAQELKLGLVHIGHNKSEELGVKELARKVVKQFNLDSWTYVKSSTTT